MKDVKEYREPRTPQQLPTSVFPTVHTPSMTLSRRPSIQNTCSSSSSLYEMTVMDDQNNAGVYVNGSNTGYGPSSAVHSCVESSGVDSSDDEDEDDDMALRHWSSRRSNELFREHFQLGIAMTPSNEKPGQQVYGHGLKNEDDASPSTPIFKRLVSRQSLKPQLKAFRRITSELQYERVPLENEINHEKLVLLNLEDEEHYLTSSLAKKNDKTIEMNNSSYKKFDIIKKANESWNMKKNGTHIMGLQVETSSDKDEEKVDQRKKRSFDSNEYNDDTPKTPTMASATLNKFKRRAVSTSPVSANFFKRSSVKLVSRASKELEDMTLSDKKQKEKI